MTVLVWVCVCDSSAQGGRRRTLDPLGLELQVCELPNIWEMNSGPLEPGWSHHSSPEKLSFFPSSWYGVKDTGKS